MGEKRQIFLKYLPLKTHVLVTCQNCTKLKLNKSFIKVSFEKYR